MNAQLETTKFGEIQYQEQDVISVPQGLPGFEKLTRFLLIDTEVYQPFKFFQSLDNPLICFPILDPRLVRPDYVVTLDEEAQKKLQLNKAEEGLVYCVVTLGSDPGKATINLFAPLVINTSAMKAAQVLLLDSGYPMDQPLG